jgi:hypothetical protein
MIQHPISFKLLQTLGGFVFEHAFYPFPLPFYSIGVQTLSCKSSLLLLLLLLTQGTGSFSSREPADCLLLVLREIM